MAMKKSLAALAMTGLVGLAQGKTYFTETFDADWESRWVDSDFKKSEGAHGTLTRSNGDFYGDAEKAYGAKTSQDARFYASAAKFPTSFSNEGKDLVVQFSVKHEQKIDCGGGYLKVLPGDADLKSFGGDTPYYLMVGPDICGTSTKKVHFIFGHEGENLLIKKEITAETDQLTHVYTFVVKPDDTYQVLVDGEERASGKLAEDWEFTAPKTIKDPEAKKPKDWVDNAKMDDPEDTKPEGYDDIPADIPDPDAEKPDDWDDEADGEWEAPTVPNPEYKGPWKARQIDNPDYKGPWVHPEIPNPDYVEKTDLYKYDNIGGIGIDVWQVKAGTIFDSIIVTDSLEEAKTFADEQFSAADRAAEKEAFEAASAKKAEEAAEAQKKIQEEREKQEAEEEDDEDDEEDDEEEDEEDEEDDAGHDEL